MQTNLKAKKNFVFPEKNFSEKKDIQEKYQIADNSELLTVSKKLMERNKKVYAELAK